MPILSNCHTHTQFCDAHCTMEEMVQAALARGFVSLGFSPHCRLNFPGLAHMTEAGEQAYFAEYKRLQALYGDRIRLYCGVEKDLFSATDCRQGYTYIIGTVHNMPSVAGMSQVESRLPCIEQLLRDEFHGSANEMAHAYLRLLGGMALATRPQIIGHFDIFMKRVRDQVDTADPRYRQTVSETLEMIRAAGCLLEINTGGMTRANQPIPYPEPWTLRRWHELGGGIIFGADSHFAEHIAGCFDAAVDYARDAGFASCWRLNSHSGALFEEISL